MSIECLECMTNIQKIDNCLIFFRKNYNLKDEFESIKKLKNEVRRIFTD